MIERRAHAKVNLHLHSVRRRGDGYHELRTIFCHLDLHEPVRVRLLEGEIRLNSSLGLPLDQDLAGRAATALRRHLGRPELGCAIDIDKALPTGGGLGGGSADAAAVLMALGSLWGADEAELLAVAARLGADVPFLLRGGLQLAGGIGERLEPLHHRCAPTDLVLLFPGVPVSTPQAFAWLDEDGLDEDAQGEAHIETLLKSLASGGWFIKHLYNGFSEPVRRRVPAVDRAMAAAAEAGFRPILCGSGSTVAAFGDGDPKHPALRDFSPKPATLAGLEGPISP